jgi:DNA-binding CsgD family transcriptional regulator
MGEGDCSAAFELLASEFEGPRHATVTPYLLAVVGVFAEVAVRSQHQDAARLILARWIPLFAQSPERARHEFELATAILDVDHPRRSLERLLACADLTSLGRARTELSVGMLLRRHRETRECRPHLIVAAELLAQSGAKPWLPIAACELRAAGVRGGSDPQFDELSPQESTIAVLAATGLSNREIGERLFLSPRTVGSHLYRTFPKLGITSRHQLAKVLDHASVR